MKEHTKASLASGILLVVLVALDQCTKFAIASRMKLHESIEVIKNFFILPTCKTRARASAFSKAMENRFSRF